MNGNDIANWRQSFTEAFVEAAPYVVRMRGQHWVFWIDGGLSPVQQADLAEEIAILSVLGAHLTVIVGDAPRSSGPVDETMQQQIDDANAAAMRRWMNLLSRGWVGMPDRRFRLCAVSGNLVTARRVGVIGGVDHGFLGAVRDVYAERIRALQQDGHVLVLSGSLPGVTGIPLVVPPLELGVEYARATQADKLVLVSTGLPWDLPAEWTRERLEAERASADDNLRPLLETAIAALSARIARVHIVSGDEHGAILTELLSQTGSGVMVAQLPSAIIDQVAPDEIAELVALLSRFEPEGQLAPRSRELIEAGLNDFRVLRVDGRIVACGALRQVGPEDALLEAIAVHHDFQGEGWGTELVQALQKQVRDRGFHRVWALTTNAEDWFRGLGFTVAADDLPPGIREALRPERNSVVLVWSAADLARGG